MKEKLPNCTVPSSFGKGHGCRITKKYWRIWRPEDGYGYFQDELSSAFFLEENTSKAIVVHFRINQLSREIGLAILVAVILGLLVYLFTPFLRISLILLLSLLLLYGVWPSLWRIYYVVFLHQPALIIDNVGIQVFPPHTPTNFFISWSEIQRISADQNKSGKYIVIYPKDKEKYFSSFSPLKRFIVWFCSPRGKTPMLLSFSYLDKPLTETFQQIAHEYASELHEHGIQLQF